MCLWFPFEYMSTKYRQCLHCIYFALYIKHLRIIMAVVMIPLICKMSQWFHFMVLRFAFEIRLGKREFLIKIPKVQEHSVKTLYKCDSTKCRVFVHKCFVPILFFSFFFISVVQTSDDELTYKNYFETSFVYFHYDKQGEKRRHDEMCSHRHTINFSLRDTFEPQNERINHFVPVTSMQVKWKWASSLMRFGIPSKNMARKRQGKKKIMPK